MKYKTAEVKKREEERKFVDPEASIPHISCGWLIIVTKTAGNNEELMRWESNAWVDWLNTLKSEGKVELSYNRGGYPYRYLVKASDLLPIIYSDERISPTSTAAFGLTVTRNTEIIGACSQDEVLQIEMWDLS